jgi:hypothetical protein
MQLLLPRFHFGHYSYSFLPYNVCLLPGEPGTGFYIVSKGAVRISRVVEGHVHELAILFSGDFFGEASLLPNGGGKRMASADSLMNTELLYLDKAQFGYLFSFDRINSHFAKREHVSQHFGNRHVNHHTGALATGKKNKAVRQLIRNAIKKNVLFADVAADTLERVVDRMYRAEYPQGVKATVRGTVWKLRPNFFLYVALSVALYPHFIRMNAYPHQEIPILYFTRTLPALYAYFTRAFFTLLGCTHAIYPN